LIIEGVGTFNFCSDSLKWIEPSKSPEAISAWTPQYLYFFRQGLWWFLDLCDVDGYDIGEERSGVKIRVNFDCQARHPFLKVQGEEWLFCGRGRRRSGEVCSYQICLYPLSSERPDVPILNRFPEGYQAAFCVTDHADYDQVGPLRAVFWGDSSLNEKGKQGLAGRGLRITKSVFARSFPEYTGIGLLDDPEFKKVAQRLHDLGNEIVPHGVRSFPATPSELSKDFKEAFSEFSPRTWIDHIYSYRTLLPHSLAIDGLKPSSSSYIWPLLQDEGIDLLWSGMDIHHNPPMRKINILDRTDNYPSSFLFRMMKSLMLGNPREAGYYFLEFYEAFAGLGKRISLKKAIRLFIDNRGLARGRINIIKEAGLDVISSLIQGNERTKAQGKGEAQLFSTQNRFPGGAQVGTFSTMRLNQLVKGLTPGNWKKVFEDRGVVLLHTYLACNHPLQDNGWYRSGSRCRIAPAFDEAVEFLSEQVSKRKLWNPTVHEMWDWYNQWKKVRVLPDSNSGQWKVVNHPQGTLEFIGNDVERGTIL